MTQQFTSTQFVNSSFVKVLFELSVTDVRVPASALVKYKVFYHDVLKRYILCVCVNGKFVGWHCGQHTGRPIYFERESDAVRLADARNAAWLALRRSVKEVA